ncbi:hypothetical protein NKR23_g12506 [Pleurostoma richardsiae]|uniref:Uncharacterized protein n=1 Tax=Pleurostoma richardsiae TaxID=41990 RepID=A0AA38R047_9PEZI|nr:hypothetical protein NKR23_g12506 [Pleurostoma richardsiae]
MAHIRGLEARLRDLVRQNQALKHENAGLKDEVVDLENEVLLHASCSDTMIEEHINRSLSHIIGRNIISGRPAYKVGMHP